MEKWTFLLGVIFLFIFNTVSAAVLPPVTVTVDKLRTVDQTVCSGFSQCSTYVIFEEKPYVEICGDRILIVASQQGVITESLAISAGLNQLGLPQANVVQHTVNIRDNEDGTCTLQSTRTP